MPPRRIPTENYPALTLGASEITMLQNKNFEFRRGSQSDRKAIRQHCLDIVLQNRQRSNDDYARALFNSVCIHCLCG